MYIFSMKFEWDSHKNISNLRKHGLDFDLAKEVFADPLHKTLWNGVYGNEERWQTVGVISGIWVIVVIHTDRSDAGDEITRIISARKATSSERNFYEKH